MESHQVYSSRCVDRSIGFEQSQDARNPITPAVIFETCWTLLDFFEIKSFYAIRREPCMEAVLSSENWSGQYAA